MSKIKFRDIRMSSANMERLMEVNAIVEEYQHKGYVLTLRQLYYQLVGRDIVPNKQSEYKKLSRILKEGRMAGIVDWSAIEDRLRFPSKPASWDGPKQVLDACIDQFELPRQVGQPYYIEVWIEKDALSGVLKKVTEPYHIPIVVNRGYASASSMFDSFFRFVRDGAYKDRVTKIIYLGDYDPSGLDMIRDIEDRIEEFREGYESDGDFVRDMAIEIIPIALNREQILQFDLPPNPAKSSDPRSGEFILEHGDSSWEVDALRPEVLNEILDNALIELMDMDIYYQVLDNEAEHIEKLKALKDQL